MIIINISNAICGGLLCSETGETVELIDVEVIPNEDNNLDFEAF